MVIISKLCINSEKDIWLDIEEDFNNNYEYFEQVALLYKGNEFTVIRREDYDKSVECLDYIFQQLDF